MANSKNKFPSKKITGLFKGIMIYILIGLAVLVLVANIAGDPNPSDQAPISQIVSDVKAGKVDKITIDGDSLEVKYKDSDKIIAAKKESTDSIYQVLKDAGVDPSTTTIEVKDTTVRQAWFAIFGNLILPILLGAAFLFFIFRHAKDAGQSIFSFGQSKAKIFNKDQPQIKFSDVAGSEEAKKELSEIVEFLKTPEKFTALGARTPKGVLMVGPAGVGKTLLARAVAGEAGVPFFSIAGSEFMEILVGVGAARVRDMFAQAKKSAPAIIFIDEIESIGRMRGNGFSGGHDEREQTLNQILVEMDGFTPNDHVIVIGATNRPDLLDTALVRPGRFDRRVVLGYPALQERKEILELHMKGKPFTKTVDLEKLARRTVGFSGADLANMVNEGAILAAREGKKAIDPEDMEEAATKVKLGPQRKRMQTEEDRKLAAYHEAGHAVVGHFLGNVDPVHRITIVARGMSGGHTMFPPTQDRNNESMTRLVEQIATALGGQAAEKMFLNDISTGAASDLEMATRIARAMVTEYGMSDLGPMAIKSEGMFGWSKGEEGGSVSQEFLNKIDIEVKKILDQGLKTASLILKSHKEKLEKVAKQLLETETIESEEFEKIVGKKKLAFGVIPINSNPIPA